MANLGNTIINGILRVNGKLNVSDAITAPSFVGELAGNANSTTNVRIRKTDPTDTGTWYYPTWTDGYTADTNYLLRANDGLRYYAQQGSTTAVGRGILQLGNSVAEGVAGCKYGELRMYGKSTGYTQLLTTSSANNRTITLPDASGTVALTSSSITGNAATATKLKTAVNINGTAFDGSGAITTANWGTARNITIGATAKSVNGSGNVSWTLAEIGAAAASHTHSYLPLAGGTMTGAITTAIQGSWLQGLKGERAIISSTSSGTSHTTLFSGNSQNGKFIIYKYSGSIGFGYASNTSISANTNGINFGVGMDESGNFVPYMNNTQAIGTANKIWNNMYSTYFTGALKGNADTATTLQTSRSIGVSGVTGTAQSFNGSKDIVIPITAVPATLLTNKSAIKGSEITNDKHWVPSSDASVSDFITMTSEEYATEATNLPTGTIVAISDGAEGYVSTLPTSLTCDLPLGL